MIDKEKLIELSDLNREDNIKYISSEAQGIAITLDSDKYAPTLCKLERAYICGRRKSEEQIIDLERKLEQTEKDLADYQFNYPKIKDLEKENAELKKEYSDNLSLKDEELMCLETEFNTYKLKAKEIILSLYNAGRDILMCGYSEETQKRLDDRINSREIEKLLEE